MIDHTHDAAATSWVAGSDTHPAFPVQNLPLGVFSYANCGRRIGTAIGDWILDVTGLDEEGLLSGQFVEALRSDALNDLFALGASERKKLRHQLFALLTSAALQPRVQSYLRRQEECTMHLPCRIGDYTDFYVGIHHAENVGRMFRPENPLLPNYKHVPIGYHGRASSVRVSGEPVVRPSGQRMLPAADRPIVTPSERLDYELELAVWIGGTNALGVPVPIDDAPERIAGFGLLNDWSARDLQAWEYQPLGPFLSKNFHTTVSPWVITAEALAPFRVAQPSRPSGDPRPLPYLWSDRDQAAGALDLTLSATISSRAMREQRIPALPLSQGPATNMYWTVAQMIAHHTSNGCSLLPGDLLGSGTISGADEGSCGSLLEITAGASKPFELPTGEKRTFLVDGDEICLAAVARKQGFRSIGFGPCRAEVVAC